MQSARRVLNLKSMVFSFFSFFIFLMLGMWNPASALMIVDMEKTRIDSKDILNFRSSLMT